MEILLVFINFSIIIIRKYFGKFHLLTEKFVFWTKKKIPFRFSSSLNNIRWLLYFNNKKKIKWTERKQMHSKLYDYLVLSLCNRVWFFNKNNFELIYNKCILKVYLLIYYCFFLFWKNQVFVIKKINSF